MFRLSGVLQCVVASHLHVVYENELNGGGVGDDDDSVFYCANRNQFYALFHVQYFFLIYAQEASNLCVPRVYGIHHQQFCGVLRSFFCDHQADYQQQQQEQEQLSFQTIHQKIQCSQVSQVVQALRVVHQNSKQE